MTSCSATSMRKDRSKLSTIIAGSTGINDVHPKGRVCKSEQIDLDVDSAHWDVVREVGYINIPGLQE
jgi:hypothetical protein